MPALETRWLEEVADRYAEVHRFMRLSGEALFRKKAPLKRPFS